MKLTNPSAWADIVKGVAAYTRSDYGGVVRECRPLVEQGDAGAQNNPGVMYDNGHGIPQDYAEARKRYRKSPHLVTRSMWMATTGCFFERHRFNNSLDHIRT